MNRILRMEEKLNKIELIDVKRIHDNPYQPRIFYYAQRTINLGKSIKRNGLINPITVRKHPTIEGDFECSSGHYRKRAFEHIGKRMIPAFVLDLSDQQMAELSLAENLQRETVNPIEIANGFKFLMTNFGYTQEDVAEVSGVSRSNVGNQLRLLKMPFFLRCCVFAEVLEPSKALLISTLPSKYEPYHLGDLAIDWSFSRREIEKILNDLKNGEIHISWIRDVEVKKLWEYPTSECPKMHASEPTMPKHPILVDITGLLWDSSVSLDDLKKLNIEKVEAEILYQSRYLLKTEIKKETKTKENQKKENIITTSLAPKPDEEMRTKLYILNKLLEKHADKYPVRIIS